MTAIRRVRPDAAAQPGAAVVTPGPQAPQ